MDPNNTIAIRTYSRETTAQFALMHLESNGIEAALSADDCGGSRPELHVASGVRLLVNAPDRGKAEEVLALFEQKQQEEDLPATPDSAPNGKPPSRFLWFVAGALLASLGWAYHVYSEKHRTGVLRYDFNNDGRWDSWWTYEKGVPVKNEQDKDLDGKADLFFHYTDGLLVKTECDQNFDGKPDLWQYHTNNLVVSSDADVNFDGRIDSRFVYRHGITVSSAHDIDYNGTFDSVATYRAGVLQTVQVRPNGSQVVSRREDYSDGILRTEWVDADMDGAFDLKRTFDCMGMEIEETSLKDNVQNKMPGHVP